MVYNTPTLMLVGQANTLVLSGACKDGVADTHVDVTCGQYNDSNTGVNSSDEIELW